MEENKMKTEISKGLERYIETLKMYQNGKIEYEAVEKERANYEKTVSVYACSSG